MSLNDTPGEDEKFWQFSLILRIRRYGAEREKILKYTPPFRSVYTVPIYLSK